MSAKIVERDDVQRKIISVSKKRQITLPIQFFKELRLGSEVECSLVDGAIVIRPFQQHDTEYSVELLQDLVSQGFTGQELVSQFEEKSRKLEKAFSEIIEEADEIAVGEKKSVTFDDVFGED